MFAVSLSLAASVWRQVAFVVEIDHLRLRMMHFQTQTHFQTQNTNATTAQPQLCPVYTEVGPSY